MPPKRTSLAPTITVPPAAATPVPESVTLPLGPTLLVLSLMVALPTSFAGFAEWIAVTEIGKLRLANARLELENTGFRVAAAQLSEQIDILEYEVSELAGRAEIDPSLLVSMDRLPDYSTARSMESLESLDSLDAPDGAGTGGVFTRLKGLLGAMGDRLTLVRRGIAYREALAAATPIVWPAEGWLSASYGYRADPFTGKRDFHPAIDISTQKGQPVQATATGRVLSARRHGNYGNLIEIDHGFDLMTRYGHLAEFAVEPGDTVERGDVIGYVGATGRATGYHVHYEIWVGDRTVDPMRLFATPDIVSTD